VHTFAVSEGDVSNTRLEQVPIASALQARLGACVLQSACNLDSLVECHRNPFVHAAHLAFAKHLPLVISPDDVWLCLVQGLGIHLSLASDEMRGAVVAHEGKLKIEVSRDDFVRGSPANDWTGVFNEFCEQLHQHLGPKTDVLAGAFSTTGTVEKAVAQIALMSAVQDYFDFSLMTLCGIRRISLLGTSDDWKSLRRRAQLFAEFGLASWTAALLPVLDQFVAAASGRVDQSFWRCFYKWNEASGGDVVSGWINVLFPYTVAFDPLDLIARADPHALVEQLKRLRGRHVANRHASQTVCTAGVGPRDAQFPSGLCQVPLWWHYHGQDIEIDVVGGFLGVSQDQQTLAVRPAIGWAVCERLSASTATAPGKSGAA
jgi:hypothetical protein